MRIDKRFITGSCFIAFLAMSYGILSWASDVQITAGGNGSTVISGGGSGSISFYQVTGSTTNGLVFVNDTFTDSDSTSLTSHTGETGATWVQHSSYTGVNSIVSNRAITASAASSAMAYASGLPPISDYDVTATLRPLDTNFTNSLGIAARVSTAANTMIFLRYITNNWGCFQITTGTSLQIGVSSTVALSSGVNYSAKLLVVGNVVTGSINGVTVCTGTTTVLTAGRIGIRGNSASTTSGIAVADITATSR